MYAELAEHEQSPSRHNDRTLAVRLSSIGWLREVQHPSEPQRDVVREPGGLPHNGILFAVLTHTHNIHATHAGPETRQTLRLHVQMVLNILESRHCGAGKGARNLQYCCSDVMSSEVWRAVRFTCSCHVMKVHVAMPLSMLSNCADEKSSHGIGWVYLQDTRSPLAPLYRNYTE